MYHSTRSNETINASLAILKGLADDGGLFVKDDLKKYTLEELKKMANLSYQDLAVVILKEFLEDFEIDAIKKIVYQAYDEKFDDKEIVRLKQFSDFSILELFHGPTLAFKDVALSILPLLIDESKRINQEGKKTIILTATSGDTGSAALKGFSYAKDTYMIVLYPTNGVSAIQEKQMLSLASSNLKVIAVDGNFDDAQRLVKKVFNNSKTFDFLDNVFISSANSINIGRLIPQIVYYFYGYFKLIGSNIGTKVNFVVPTGNFGNILAGYLAKKMGLPINKLICASNDNKVLTEFFNTLEYNKNRKFLKTTSPSMDILVSSNLERLLYYGYQDVDIVKGLMSDLDKEGKYNVSSTFISSVKEFYAESASVEEVEDTINEVYNKYNYLIDTHTAVAVTALNKYAEKTKDNTKSIVLATAHPYKFPLAITKALNLGLFKDEFKAIDELKINTKVEEPEMISKLKKEYSKVIWKQNECYDNIIKLLMEIAND